MKKIPPLIEQRKRRGDYRVSRVLLSLIFFGAGYEEKFANNVHGLGVFGIVSLPAICLNLLNVSNNVFVAFLVNYSLSSPPLLLSFPHSSRSIHPSILSFFFLLSQDGPMSAECHWK